MTQIAFANVRGEEVQPKVKTDRRRRRLSTIVARYAPKNRPYIVSLHRCAPNCEIVAVQATDESVRLRKQWPQTLVGGDCVVLFTTLPLGGSGGGGASGGGSTAKSVGMALAAVALAIAAPYAVGALGVGALGGVGSLTLAGQLASAGLVVGGTWALSKALQPAAAGASQSEENRPLYGVGGGGNLPRRGDRIPAGYGAFWTKPDLTQPDYTVYDGEDQILYKRMTLGLGKYVVDRIDVGNATFWTAAGGIQPPFSYPGDGGAVVTAAAAGGIGLDGSTTYSSGGSTTGAAVEVIAPGGSSSLVPASVFSAPDVIGIELPYLSDTPGVAGPFVASPSDEPATTYQLDWSLPEGAFQVDQSNAANSSRGWGVLFSAMPIDADDNPTGDAFTVFTTGGTLNTHQAKRYTTFVTLASGRYAFTAYNTVPADRDTGSNTIMWDGLRSHFPETITRPHVTEVAMRIRSGKALTITSFSEVWVHATRVLPVWNGTAWVDQVTTKAVYAFKDILQSTYGGNLTDSDVDLNTIKARAADITTNDEFSGVIRGPVSVYEAAATVLGPIRGEPTRLGSVWSFHRDEPAVIRKHVISRRQMTKGSSAATWDIAKSDGSADVIIEYSPNADPRRRREVRVTFGAETFTPRRRNLVGVTNYNHAHSIATWMAAAAFFRRKTRKATVELQGRIVRRGDPVWFDTWFMGNARAAGVFSLAGSVLTVDTDVDVPDDTYILIRDRRGREFGPILVTAGDEPNKVVLDADDLAAAEDSAGQTLSATLSPDKYDQTSVLIGPFPTDAFIVSSVQPQNKTLIAVEAINDAQEVWDALGEAAPAEPVIPSRGDEQDPAIAALPWVRARCVQKTTTIEIEWAVGTARGAHQNIVDITYDDGLSWTRVNDTNATTGLTPMLHTDATTVKVMAFAVNGYGVPGPPVFYQFDTFKPFLDSSNVTISIGAFNEALKKQVTSALTEVSKKVEAIEQLFSAVVASVDTEKVLDKQQVRRELLASADALNASIETVETAIVTTEAAFAEYQVTAGARFNDVEADASLALSSVATVEGKLAAKAALTLTVGGKVSGIFGYSDDSFSSFDIQADVFRVGSEGASGGSFIPVFQVGTVNGVAAITMRGNLIADGDIKARNVSAGEISTIHLAAEAVTAAKIAAGAIWTSSLIATDVIITGHLQVNSVSVVDVTNPADLSFSDFSASPITLASLGIFVSSGSGGNLLVDLNCQIDSFNGTFMNTVTAFPQFGFMTVGLYFDGNLRKTQKVFPKTPQNGSGATWYIDTVIAIPETIKGVAAGSHTVLATLTTSPSGLPLNVRNISLRCLESKR